jgi:hypothetical protein
MQIMTHGWKSSSLLLLTGKVGFAKEAPRERGHAPEESQDLLSALEALHDRLDSLSFCCAYRSSTEWNRSFSGEYHVPKATLQAIKTVN